MAKMVMVNDSERYAGLYVTTKNFIDKNVITSGSDLLEVYNEAIRKGVDEPVIFFVPDKEMVHIY